ncbi:hypothetical protein, partial [Leptospira meyeri]|uniref:hypothetical protein n=1 Tax=Leptospira meyeri TaxID=29508 RepID=UPI00143853BD
ANSKFSSLSLKTYNLYVLLSVGFLVSLIVTAKSELMPGESIYRVQFENKTRNNIGYVSFIAEVIPDCNY